MPPFACERRVSIPSQRKARRGCDGKKWMRRGRRTTIGRTPPIGCRSHAVPSIIGAHRSSLQPITGRTLRDSCHVVGLTRNQLKRVYLLKLRPEDRSGCDAKRSTIVQLGTAHPTPPMGRNGRRRGGEKQDGKIFAAHAPKFSSRLSDRRYFSICVGCHASFPKRTNPNLIERNPKFVLLLRFLHVPRKTGDFNHCSLVAIREHGTLNIAFSDVNRT